MTGAGERTALVTGGAGGIGEGIVTRLADAGHPVGIGWATEHGRARAEELAARLHPCPAIAVPCDVASPASVHDAVATVTAALGPPLVLVNNGAVNIGKTLARTSGDKWDRIVAVNLVGALRTTRAVLPTMLERGWGRIVNVSSPAGTVPFPVAAPYGATKAGLQLLTRVLALECARSGVTVNAVQPGVVLSEMMTSIPAAALQANLEAQSAPRPVEPGEVGAAVAFLVSDAAEMVNGQVIGVHGGGIRLTFPGLVS